jgi:signal peptidase I
MILEHSGLKKHQIYFWQSFGCQWMMPISEHTSSWSNGKIDVYVDLLACSSMREITNLPKHDKIRDYLVEKKVKEGRRVYSTWELPKDKWGFDPLYKKFAIKKDYLLNSILLPFDVIKEEYPGLYIDLGNGEIYPNGISKEKEKIYKREFLIKNILNEQSNISSNSVFSLR